MLKIIKLVAYYFVYQLIFSAVVMALSRWLMPMDMGTMTSLIMVASPLAMAWHLLHFKYVSIKHDRYRRVGWSVLCISAVFIFSATYVLNVVIEQLGIPNTMEDAFIAMSRNPLGLFSIALLAPILEELLFRGAIEGQLLCRWQNPWWGIVVSSLIFGVIHGNPAQIPFAFLVGVMFGWLYYRTGSLLPGIVGHVLNNSIAAVNMMLYGHSTIEEQMEDVWVMWLWVGVAFVVFVLAAVWLNGHIGALNKGDRPKDEEI